jgi:short-subunit dehydrogenase
MATQSIFITGGSSGLGLELANLYHQQGWRVGVCGRDPKKLEVLKDRFEVYVLDVSDREAVKKTIADFASKGIDVVIANAGIAYKNKTKLPDFDYSIQMIHTDFLGVVYTFEAALEHFIPNKSGHLVAVSSVAGLNGLPGVSCYSASKAAVMKLCETFSIDLKQHNIFTSCVIPGFIDTPLTQVNPHPMPFMISAEAAARIVQKGIVKKKQNIVFPKKMYFLTRFLSILPRSVYCNMMSIKRLNYSRK